jgi:hypothetical protein
MFKLFIIFLAVIVLAILGLSYFINKLKNLFSVFNPAPKQNNANTQKKSDVIYDKDGVVVLKGESDSKGDSSGKTHNYQ